MKQLITEQDIRQCPPTGPIIVTPDTIITPAALDAAYARGLKVVFATEAGVSPADSGPSAPVRGPSNAPGGIGVTVPSAVGRTYVVHVTSGGAQVFEPKGDALARV